MNAAAACTVSLMLFQSMPKLALVPSLAVRTEGRSKYMFPEDHNSGLPGKYVSLSETFTFLVGWINLLNMPLKRSSWNLIASLN
jgi:hypothetical protein